MKTFAVGLWVNKDIGTAVDIVKRYDRLYKDRLHDVHFAHYENSLIASGRFQTGLDEKGMFSFIEQARSATDIPLTLLMNYLIEKDYRAILKVFDKYYKSGIRSVVIADLDLIRHIKQSYPDVEIQGSCLSYRITEEDLEEEAKEGVTLHNPAVDIIRMPKQLKANSEAGFKQKVLFAEGCFHSCKFEKMYKGHRWHIARNMSFTHPDMCESQVMRDIRDFFTANWVTIHQLRMMDNFIDVVKLPRGQVDSTYVSEISPGKLTVSDMVIKSFDDFVYHYDNNLPHNVLEYNAVAYNKKLRKHLGYVNSSLFDENFYQISSNCKKKCTELNCRLCYEMLEKIKNQQPFEVSGRDSSLLK